MFNLLNVLSDTEKNIKPNQWKCYYFLIWRVSSRVTLHFQAVFLKIDYVKTTNDFEMRLWRIFLFILELWTQFLIVHKNHSRDFHMFLNMPLSKKSRAHGVNDCDLPDNLKKKPQKLLFLIPLDMIRHKLYTESEKFTKLQVFENKKFLLYLCANNSCKNILYQNF